jgi:hypothetical protein
MFYNPQTQRVFASGKAAGHLGMTPETCGDFGLVAFSTEPYPTVTAMQTAALDDLPTEVGGVWARRWTVTDLPAGEARARMVPLSRAQFAIALAAAGVITETEADAWLDGVVPAFALAAINAHPTWTDAEKMAARFKAKAPGEIDRTNPIVSLLQAAKSLTDAQVDALFIAGAGI